jgi:predicted metal-dependent phosphoesterase TrpH
MGTVPAVLETASRAGLDAIAITDHNVVRGALEAHDLAPRFGLSVVPGVEITTSEGHLIGLWLTRAVPMGLPLLETVLRVADLGGVCIAPHPDGHWVPSLRPHRIVGALRHPTVAKTLLGLEVYNGGLVAMRSNRRAAALGEATGLARVASSDSHLLWTIGMGSVEYSGITPAALRHALENRLTTPLVRERPFSYYLSFAKGWMIRELGLAYWTPEPGQDIVLRRLAALP